MTKHKIFGSGLFSLRRMESKGIPTHVHLFEQAVFRPSLKSTGVPQTKVENTGIQSDSPFPPSLKRCNLPKEGLSFLSKAYSLNLYEDE